MHCEYLDIRGRIREPPQVAVVEMPAARLPKNMKRWYVDRWLSETGQDAAANQDVADAIFIGLTAPWDLGGRAA